jgi:uncharacterized membrane protein
MNAALARLLLSVAYPLLAHAASTLRDPRLAALALLDIVLILLVVPLLRRRGWAWALAFIAAVALWAVQRSDALPVMLLLPPVLFPWLVAWFFARTLRAGEVPLITRIVAGVEGQAPEALSPALVAYSRGLTRVWACVLAGIGAANLLLGLVAVPDGLLVQLGYVPPVTVSQVAWSWFANLLDYGLVALLLVIEYLVRARKFPQRPYATLPGFVRRVGTLGPTFWRDVLR